MTDPKLCRTCKNSVDQTGQAFENGDRAYCLLKQDSETKQPIPCESERFAVSGLGCCGTEGVYWEKR